MTASLFIAGIEIPIEASEGLSQDLELIQFGVTRRLADKSLIYRGTAGNKYRTRISGGGWASVGLDGVDFTQAVVIKCIKTQSFTSLTTSVTLPQNRRSDVTPVGYAVVDGQMVSTTINSIVTDVATLESVAGASSYGVEVWPEITVIGAIFTERVSQDTGKYSWSLSAEEQ